MINDIYFMHLTSSALCWKYSKRWWCGCGGGRGEKLTSQFLSPPPPTPSPQAPVKVFAIMINLSSYLNYHMYQFTAIHLHIYN